jgi:ACR3 family arsenite transporter
MTVLRWAARYGRLMLVLGLAAGLALPSLALAMKPWLQELVAGLLFVAALRIGPSQALGSFRDLPVTASVALVYQLFLPLLAIAGFAAIGMTGYAIAGAIVLMLAASSISGSPNLTILTGHDPAPALRLLILGTAILPLTVVPVFWALPALGTPGEVLAAAGRLFGTIAIATVLAFVVRITVLKNPSLETVEALDGLSAIAMAVVVVGLMSAAGPALISTPGKFAIWLGAAFAANLGFQIAAALILRKTRLRSETVPFAIIAGNRNIALFLVALPASVTDPLLLFIGCYQIPMYLTPLIMPRVFRSLRL